METVSIYYNDNDNSFMDDFGSIEYDISDIMPLKMVIRHKEIGGTYYAKNITPGIIYEIEFPIRDTDRSLIYYSIDNTFNDEDDEIVFNIFSIITPNDVYLFKRNRRNICIRGVQGGMIDLVYYKGAN